MKMYEFWFKRNQKFVPKGPNYNMLALVKIMAWLRPDDKPLSEPMIVYWRIYASLGLNEVMLEIVASNVFISPYF